MAILKNKILESYACYTKVLSAFTTSFDMFSDDISKRYD